MTEVATIPAEARERAGKGAARATRRAGRVPAVIYGDKQDSLLVSIDPQDLAQQMRRHGFFSRLFDVAVAGKKHRCLARDVQLHPVSDRPLHVDFMRVGADTKVSVDVEVRFLNELKSPGLKRGGVLNVVRHAVSLVCTPDRIPETLSVDLTGLDIGDSIHISHIKLPEGVRPAIADRDFTVATIAPPTVVKMETAEAAAAAAVAPAAGEAAVAAAPAAAEAAPAKAEKAGGEKKK